MTTFDYLKNMIAQAFKTTAQPDARTVLFLNQAGGEDQADIPATGSTPATPAAAPAPTSLIRHYIKQPR